LKNPRLSGKKKKPGYAKARPKLGLLGGDLESDLRGTLRNFFFSQFESRRRQWDGLVGYEARVP